MLSDISRSLKFIARHPISSRKPLAAFARYAWWQMQSRLKHEIVFDWIGGSKLIVRNGMTGATGNIYCGLHEFTDMAFVMHFLRPGDVFIDVGANVGSYTVLASRVAGANTIAIEPDPETCRSLRRNVEANGIGDRVRVIEAAVGDSEGTIDFTIGQDTTNHVAEINDVERQTVALTRIDAIVDEPAPICMKLDVEGFEAKAIEGAEAALEDRTLRAVLIETVDSSVRRRLHDLGFKERVFEPFGRKLSDPKSDRTTSSANTLFIRDDAFCAGRLKTAAVRDAAGVRI